VYEDAEVKIESDCGVELPAGQSGIIAVRTSQMVTSYWTQDAPDIFRDGWFYPGDIGYLTENNELYVEGRVDARLNYEGQKILATSLESELCEVDGVDDAFVTVCPRPNTREDCLVAMIASELDSSALRRLASPILSPRRFRLIVVPRVPRNHMGKLERGPLTAYCEQQIQKAADA
jgi:acyl-coenzyme A synthetase/AMP-(fatty) acid ligase